MNSKHKTAANKRVACWLLALGASLLVLTRDATFFVFMSMLGGPLFFAKENWIL